MGETSEIYYNNRIKLHITFPKDTIHIFIHYVRLKRQNMWNNVSYTQNTKTHTPQNAVFPLTKIHR